MKLLNKKRKIKRQSSVPASKTQNKKKILVPILPKKNLGIKENFIAKSLESQAIAPNSMTNDNNKEIESIIKGEDLIFEKRKEKAKKLLRDLNQIDIKEQTNSNIIKDKIKEIISYDNTNKAILYKCLKYYKALNDKTEVDNLLNIAKFCFTKKDEFFDDNNNKISIDFVSDFQLSNAYFMFENENDIINSIIKAINNLEEVFQNIKEIEKQKLEEIEKKKLKEKEKIELKEVVEKKFEEMLKNKTIKNKDNLYTIEKKRSKDEDEQKVYDNIYEFLFNFMFIKEFEYYQLNQPIDYKINPIIYLINIFYKVYEITTNVTKRYNKTYVSINEEKMRKIYTIRNYINNLFSLLNNNKNKINKEIDDKFDTLFLVLESEEFPDNLEEIMNLHINSDIPITKSELEKFIHDIKDEEKIFKLDNNKLRLKYQGNEYEFNYKNYNNQIFDFLGVKSNKIIEQAKWNKVGLINYFDEEDLLYMKGILKNILQSKLFKELYSKYSNTDKIIDYYFNENSNIDDLLNRIKFIPYKEGDTGRQAGTIKKELKIITSSYYISNIDSEKDFIIYKILELARKIIILLHEIVHFIKRALHLISNGKILESTIETEKEDPNIIEAGRFFETIIFNWKNPYKKRTKSLNKRGKKNEEEEFSKNLNIEKALKILDPNYYNQTIDDFQNNFYNKEIKKDNIDKGLVDYLKKIKFNFSHYVNNKKEYNHYKINCSRKVISNYTIEYISENHNFTCNIFKRRFRW